MIFSRIRPLIFSSSSSSSPPATNMGTGGEDEDEDEEGAVQYDYIIVGGGVCAGYICKQLVESGIQSGSILLLSTEACAPYERPVLSKSYLHHPGAAIRSRLPQFHTAYSTLGEIQDVTWYQRHGITLVLGNDGRVSELDLQEKQVTTEAGSMYKYKHNLFIATGLRPLMPRDLGLHGSDLKNIFTLREESHAAALVKRLEELPEPSQANLVIIGGSFLGVEA